MIRLNWYDSWMIECFASSIWSHVCSMSWRVMKQTDIFTGFVCFQVNYVLCSKQLFTNMRHIERVKANTRKNLHWKGIMTITVKQNASFDRCIKWFANKIQSAYFVLDIVGENIQSVDVVEWQYFGFTTETLSFSPFSFKISLTSLIIFPCKFNVLFWIWTIHDSH